MYKSQLEHNVVNKGSVVTILDRIGSPIVSVQGDFDIDRIWPTELRDWASYRGSTDIDRLCVDRMLLNVELALQLFAVSFKAAEVQPLYYDIPVCHLDGSVAGVQSNHMRGLVVGVVVVKFRFPNSADLYEIDIVFRNA
mgnify:CR=1 FL=1